MTSVPVFIVIRAEWCGHCKQMKPELDKLVETFTEKFKDDGLKLATRIMELEEYNELAAQKKDALIKTLEANKATSRGVPFIALHDTRDLHVYDRERTAPSMARFILERLRHFNSS